MSRALLAVGCNSYDNFPSLTSAETDAKRVGQLVIGTSPQSYRADLSRVLFSPSLLDVRSAFSTIYEDRPSSIFIYFAGHAESRDGRLYMKLRDTRDTSLPLSALSFGDLLDLVVGIPGIAEINIVIDACNAGGLSGDLAKHLGAQAQQIPGQASIAILAGASSSLGAVETASGGILTGAICDVLTGVSVAQRHSRFLDLLQVSETIGRVPKVERQHPSYWGMNLRGPNHFAPNPAFDPAIAATTAPDEFFKGDVRLDAAQLDVMRKFLNAVEAREFDPSDLRPVQQILSKLPVEQQSSVIIGLSETILNHDNQESLPVIRDIMLMQGLLPLSDNNNVRQLLDFFVSRLITETVNRLILLNGRIIERKYSLMERAPGFSELYFLPLTVLEVLGWIRFVLVHGTQIEASREKILRELTRRILDIYGNSVVCIEDRRQRHW